MLMQNIWIVCANLAMAPPKHTCPTFSQEKTSVLVLSSNFLQNFLGIVLGILAPKFKHHKELYLLWTWTLQELG